MLVDTHCHLDAPEFAPDVDAVVERAHQAGVALCVLPAVAAAHFDTVRALAQRHGCAYALGIHPLWVPQAAGDISGSTPSAPGPYISITSSMLRTGGSVCSSGTTSVSVHNTAKMPV